MRDGKLVPAVKADVSRLRKTDSVNIMSESTGINPSQKAEFERAFGHLGVKYTPDGVAVYKDRKSKLAVLKARGFHDKNEVSG